MVDEQWPQIIEVDGLRFQAEFFSRPFREGIEVRIKTSQGIISIAELGLGERAIREKVISLVRSRGLTPATE